MSANNERQEELPFFFPVTDEQKEGQDEDQPDEPVVDSLLEDDAENYFLWREEHKKAS